MSGIDIFYFKIAVMFHSGIILGLLYLAYRSHNHFIIISECLDFILNWVRKKSNEKR